MKLFTHLAALSLLVVACVSFGHSVALAQQSTLRGFITSDTDGLPLQGVNVILTIDSDPDAFIGTVSDDDGFYVFSRLNAGNYTLRASFIGFQTYTDEFRIEESGVTNLSFALEEGDTELDEVLVEVERETGAARVTAGLQTVRAGDLELIPSPDVTSDLVSYLSTQCLVSSHSATVAARCLSGEVSLLTTWFSWME